MEPQTGIRAFVGCVGGQVSKARSLRVHKKSRNGCLQCKRRKVKVCLGFLFFMVPDVPADMTLTSAMRRSLDVTIASIGV